MPELEQDAREHTIKAARDAVSSFFILCFPPNNQFNGSDEKEKQQNRQAIKFQVLCIARIKLCVPFQKGGAFISKYTL